MAKRGEVMTHRDLPSKEYLHSLFTGDSETGILIRKELDTHPKEWNTRFANKPAGNLKPSGYMFVGIDGKSYLYHRIIWAFFNDDPGEFVVDHINGDKKDNRLCNLRLATRSQNQRNRKGKSNSGLPKGVEYSKLDNRYRVNLSVGSFSTVEEAETAYKEAATKLFGEFAYHNRVTHG